MFVYELWIPQKIIVTKLSSVFDLKTSSEYALFSGMHIRHFYRLLWLNQRLFFIVADFIC
jgi:hypothetical protein